MEELASGGRSGAADRLRGVLRSLDPTGAPRLAGHIQEALNAVDRGRKEN
jgi:hypothetical protein